MQISRALAASIALCFLGCGAAPGVGTFWRSAAIEPELGLIAFTSAPLVGSNATVVVDPHPELCCVLVVLPGRRGSFTGSTDSELGRTTRSTYTFRTDVGEISFDCAWDKFNDIVELAGARYSRTAGNMFVARYGSNGAWTVQQVGTIQHVGAPTDVLEEIQRQLADDPLIASLSIAPSANNGIVQRP